MIFPVYVVSKIASVSDLRFFLGENTDNKLVSCKKDFATGENSFPPVYSIGIELMYRSDYDEYREEGAAIPDESIGLLYVRSQDEYDFLIAAGAEILATGDEVFNHSATPNPYQG